MKSASVMFRLEATRPPTLTDAPLPNRMPFGLTRNTLPLAIKVPRMLDGSDPSTRFSATELLFGWTKRTDSPAATLKLCQLIAALWVDWLMTRLPGTPPMVALPAATTPFAGAASAPVPIIISEMASALMVIAAPPLVQARARALLPALPGLSEAATKVPVASFQIDR